MPIRAFINMAANHCKPGELFRRFHFQNVEKNSFSEENTEEVDGASDNLSVESDYQAEMQNQAEVLPETTTKRKVSSDPNVHQHKSARKSNKKSPKVRALDSGTGGTSTEVSQSC